MLTPGWHCCLWCLIKKDQLKKDPSQRGPIEARTIDLICNDYERFNKAGKNHNKAKLFNNVIEEPFFPSISLTQVHVIKNHP